MTGVIIQARMGSTRLPGKIMRKLAGHEVLWHVVDRCRSARGADIVIVATTTASKDSELVAYCENNAIECFRGNEEDVLERYYLCAKQYGLDTIVRVTSDCPLIEPLIIDESIRAFCEKKVDYLSNCLDRIFPRGLDCEVFSFKALEDAFKNARLPAEREHVTPYIIAHATTAPYRVPADYEGDFRLTLDVEVDYQLLQKVYAELYDTAKKPPIDARAVIRYLREHPVVAKLNEEVRQKSSIG